MTGNAILRNRLPRAGAGFVWDTEQPALALRPEAAGVQAAFTTRLGGVSPEPCHWLNLSFREERAFGDAFHEERVLANRGIAGRLVGADERWSTVRQVHGADVVRATTPSRRHDADAQWTDDPRRTIAVLAADCIPLLLVADGRAAVVHAGWRGLVAGVVEAAVAAAGPAEAWAGPAIGPCCFEVGPEVVDVFSRRWGDDVVADERHVDLWAAAELSLAGAGVHRSHVARLCTACHPELFFSHRRDGGRTGRHGLVARLGER